jgi:hypothetical protein
MRERGCGVRRRAARAASPCAERVATPERGGTGRERGGTETETAALAGVARPADADPGRTRDFRARPRPGAGDPLCLCAFTQCSSYAHTSVPGAADSRPAAHSRAMVPSAGPAVTAGCPARGCRTRSRARESRLGCCRPRGPFKFARRTAKRPARRTAAGLGVGLVVGPARRWPAFLRRSWTAPRGPPPARRPPARPTSQLRERRRRPAPA